MKNLAELYTSTTAFEEIEEAIDFCRINLTSIEITKYIDPKLLDQVDDEELNFIKDLIEENDINYVAFHAAFYDLVPNSRDPKIVSITKERLKASLNLARRLDATTLIVHSGYNPFNKSNSYVNSFADKQIKFWRNFISENSVNDLTIALENTFEEHPGILLEILEGVDSQYFRSCIDTGHVNCFSNHNNIYWINALKDHLHHFHLHNNHGKTDEHNALQDGSINFNEIFSELQAIKMPISLSLEMSSEAEITKSLDIVSKTFPINI